MNIDAVKSVSSSIVGSARKVAKKSYDTVKNAFDDSVARSNLKKSLPTAFATMGVFSLMSVLPNRKADGKQGKLEKKSGAIASVVFAALSYKKFFNVEGKGIKDIFSELKKLNTAEALNLLKINKSNLILFLVSIFGVKLLTNIATKGIDGFINEAANVKKLGE